MSGPDAAALSAALEGRAVAGGPTIGLRVRVDAGRRSSRSVPGPGVDAQLSDGTLEVSGELAEPEVVVSLAPDVADALVDGALDLADAYMRGDAKIEGEPGPVIDVIRWFSGLGVHPPD